MTRQSRGQCRRYKFDEGYLIGLFTWMDGIRACDTAGFNDLLATEVGLGGRGGADKDGFIGDPDKQGVLITIGGKSAMEARCENACRG